MTWAELQSGNYLGKSLPQIVFVNPRWLFMPSKDHSFSNSQLREQLKDVVSKARRIKLPPDKFLHSVVEYVIDPRTKKIAGVHVIPVGYSRHSWNLQNVWKNNFDLSVPMLSTRYDRIGGKLIIKAIKKYALGYEDVNMSRKRCEEFFTDERNFA